MTNTTNKDAVTLEVPPFVKDSDILSSMRLHGGAKYWLRKRTADDAVNMTDAIREFIDAYNAHDSNALEIVKRIKQNGRGKSVMYVKQSAARKTDKRAG